ncbi:MAG: hypothetical protein J6W15_05115 [Clostridia bacterium]|nr:hypothetical protein [Oscillospiraceae bacterium]MBO7162183.1 hypothetical protein [Clostridia bacterium]
MKRYAIAQLQVDMDVSGRTLQQAEPYACEAEGPADIILTCDIGRIMELNPQLPNEEVAEYLGMGAAFARELLAFQGTYLHASAVILDGKAYLFSAPSGTGKSTHTEKWCRLFGATYLNDDKPALRLVDGVWMAYGTPWSGKHDLSDPKGVPLGGIAFLRRGQENSIRRLPSKEAIPRFMSQSLWRVSQQAQMEKQLMLADSILRQIPIWELTCRNDDDAARVAREAMLGTI